MSFDFMLSNPKQSRVASIVSAHRVVVGEFTIFFVVHGLDYIEQIDKK